MHTHTHTHIRTLSWCSSRYSLTVANASCTACSGGYPVPSHPQQQKINIHLARTGAVTDLCVCVRLLSALLFLFLFFPRQVSVFSPTILTLWVSFFSHFLSFRLCCPCEMQTHLLVAKRQTENDYRASSFFIQQTRLFRAGELFPLLEKHRGGANSLLAEPLHPNNTQCDFKVIISHNRIEIQHVRFIHHDANLQ